MAAVPACDRYRRVETVSCADTEELAEARESRKKFVGGLVCACRRWPACPR